MVIADLVTSKEMGSETVNSKDWCDCIDGPLTKEHYIDSIRNAGGGLPFFQLPLARQAHTQNQTQNQTQLR